MSLSVLFENTRWNWCWACADTGTSLPCDSRAVDISLTVSEEEARDIERRREGGAGGTDAAS